MDTTVDSDSIYRILGGVYISSARPLLEDIDLRAKYGIENIVSVQKEPIPEYYKDYNRLHVQIDDLASENLFLHFQKVNRFIDECLHGEKEGKVLIHCNAGRSRSVSFVVAYLMKRYHLNYKQALYAVQRKYPKEDKVGPNEGFTRQLQLYYECGCCDDVKELDAKYPQYRGFKMSLLQRSDVTSDAAYKDIKEVGEKEGGYVLRCKKCGQVLANSKAVIPHDPPSDEDDKQKYFYKTTFYSKEVVGVQKASSECTHFFVEPVNWMKPELGKGELEGRFDCFKCGSKIGGYRWQGSRCSCGRWMVPAIHLQKAKVDKVMNVR
ncbi:DEKNAAC101828 [Brettanomyces naardenensis]|uniref:protein-tyrosine-phosphatase n=1 Tax=Brettanomyces naardenensis TaxID=13370 RepID=A0A448YJ51_BRENA|nr:DEKNAAC101828 [Brettanomyces naardenensis]